MSRRTITVKIRNKAMNTFSSYEIFKKIRTKTEAARKEENRPHEVLYFHKADDPYSHLTIHCIKKLQASYDIVLKPILVGDISENDINPSNGFKKYGKIKTSYILVVGSVQGPSKRQLLITTGLRPTRNTSKKNYEFMELR